METLKDLADMAMLEIIAYRNKRMMKQSTKQRKQNVTVPRKMLPSQQVVRTRETKCVRFDPSKSVLTF